MSFSGGNFGLGGGKKKSNSPSGDLSDGRESGFIAPSPGKESGFITPSPGKESGFITSAPPESAPKPDEDPYRYENTGQSEALWSEEDTSSNSEDALNPSQGEDDWSETGVDVGGDDDETSDSESENEDGSPEDGKSKKPTLKKVGVTALIVVCVAVLGITGFNMWHTSYSQKAAAEKIMTNTEEKQQEEETGKALGGNDANNQSSQSNQNNQSSDSEASKDNDPSANSGGAKTQSEALNDYSETTGSRIDKNDTNKVLNGTAHYNTLEELANDPDYLEAARQAFPSDTQVTVSYRGKILNTTVTVPNADHKTVHDWVDANPTSVDLSLLAAAEGVNDIVDGGPYYYQLTIVTADGEQMFQKFNEASIDEIETNY